MDLDLLSNILWSSSQGLKILVQTNQFRSVYGNETDTHTHKYIYIRVYAVDTRDGKTGSKFKFEKFSITVLWYFRCA